MNPEGVMVDSHSPERASSGPENSDQLNLYWIPVVENNEPADQKPKCWRQENENIPKIIKVS